MPAHVPYTQEQIDKAQHLFETDPRKMEMLAWEAGIQREYMYVLARKFEWKRLDTPRIQRHRRKR